MMNSVFASSPGAQAPKRSNSGREIMYIQNQRLIGSGQPVQDAFISQQNLVASREIPHDVADVFNTVLRKYSFRDLYHWLKIDRKDELSRFSTQFNPGAVEPMNGALARGPLPSSARTSRTSSVFSMPQFGRDSFASSRTSWSIVSDPGPGGDRASAVMTPDHMSMGPMPLEGNGGMMSPLNKAGRSSTVPLAKPNARQRENELEVKKRYFCTACNKGFARKYDWKVHEQRYHEQQFQYPCPDCNQILYAETHFRSHHRDAHGCAQCSHAKEVTREVDARRRRTSWGCGFCTVLLDDWEKRCDHISQHYDDGMRRSDWDHSKVIIGLLRQPDIDPEWQSYLISKHGNHPNPPLALRFSKETTSRSHGDNLQLQDLLELGAIGRDVSAIVHLAYEQGVRNGTPDSSKGLDTVKEEQESSISPPTDAAQDSVMGSPTTEPATLPTQGSSFFPASPMEFTTQTTEVQQSPMTPMAAENGQVNGINSMYSFGPNGFNESLFPNGFMSNPHHSLPYSEKALPPLPVENGEVAMLPSQNTSEPQAGAFDSWMLTSSSYADEASGMVLATFDPRNQF